MICISRRAARNPDTPSLQTSLPSNTISPEVGSMSLRIDRPVVVFPHPDSPTRLNVSPRAMSNDTSFTARTCPEVRANIPLLMGKLFVRFLTEMSGPCFSASRSRSTILMRSLVSMAQLGNDPDIRRALPAVRRAVDVDAHGARARLLDDTVTCALRKSDKGADAPARTAPTNRDTSRGSDSL